MKGARRETRKEISLLILLGRGAIALLGRIGILLRGIPGRARVGGIVGHDLTSTP